MQPDNTYVTAQANNNYTPRQTIIAVISLIAFCFTILITISILFPLLHESKIEPINTSSDSTLSQIDLSAVEKQLQLLLKFSYDLPPETINNVKAVIREDTISYTTDDKGKVTDAKFIIDVNNPKLTFQVDDQIDVDFVSLTCPSIELAQDSNVFCIGYGNQSTIDANLSQYLPYRGNTSSNVEFTIWQDFDDNNRPRLNTWANICDNETIGKEVESSIKYWIMQHGIPNPDIIPTNLHYSFCNSHGE